jgi:exosortase
MSNGEDKMVLAARLRALAAISLAALAVAVTWGAWCEIFQTGWNDEESSQVLLVPLAVACIVWVRRGKFAQWRYRHQWVGPALIVIGWVLSSLGYRQGRLMCLDLGAIVTVIGALVTFAGIELLIRFLPAVGALAFLIPPMPQRRYLIAQPMGEITARITQFVCQLLHMHVERHGNLLTLNGVEVCVAEACNGMRMVIVLLLACYLYCFVMPLRRSVRIMLLAASPLIAIVCNVIRLVPTVWMFGNASSRAAQTFHDATGWLMIGVAFVLLMGIVQMAQRLTAPRTYMVPTLKGAT